MWDSNPRVFQHHDLDQELFLVLGLTTHQPQRGPVTTWVILLGEIQVPGIKSVRDFLGVAVRNLEVASSGNRTRVNALEEHHSTIELWTHST